MSNTSLIQELITNYDALVDYVTSTTPSNFNKELTVKKAFLPLSNLKEALEKDCLSNIPNDVVYNTLFLAKNILRLTSSTSYSSSKCIAIAELKYLLLDIETFITAKNISISRS